MRVLKLPAYDPTAVLMAEEIDSDVALSTLRTHIVYQRVLQAVMWPNNTRGPREHRQKMLELQRAVKAAGEVRDIVQRDENGEPRPKPGKMRLVSAKGASISLRTEALWDQLKKCVETYFSEAGVDIEQAELTQNFLDDVPQVADEPAADSREARRRKLAGGRPKLLRDGRA